MSHITELFLPLDAEGYPIEPRIAHHLRIRIEDIRFIQILRRSLDARKGRPLGYRLKVMVFIDGDTIESPAPSAAIPQWNKTKPKPHVVIVGSGPAGTWAALRLAEAGVPSTILERGKPIQPRRHDLASIQRGRLNPESNYCFGEGGAGTYSDGKLYTRTKDRQAVSTVIADLIRMGAPPEIAIESRPHVGSNRLPKVLQALRDYLQNLGVNYRFENTLVDLSLRNGRIFQVRTHTGEEIQADVLILACGHSARDVYRLLQTAGIGLERKGTAIGVRLEHPQAIINQIQYGHAWNHPMLPAAFYELSTQVENRGVYSFCMCPGGFIVPAATEAGGVVVNGMSLSRRDSPHANAAIVATVNPNDFGGDPADPLAGIYLQRKIEEAAYTAGESAYRAPAQRLMDFLNQRDSSSLPKTSYHPGIVPCRMENIFPPFIAQTLLVGLRKIIQRIPEFGHPDAVMIAAETRTSAPVRMMRDPATLESPSVAGIYPAGEGAGYAGGIVSAAIDGMRIAQMILAPGLR